MNLSGDEIKTLQKLIDSPDWEVYQKVITNIRESMKEYALTQISPTETDENYAAKMRVVSIYITCLDRIDKDIRNMLSNDKGKSIDEILEEFDPYKKGNK